MINAPVFVNSSVPWNAYDGALQPVNDIFAAYCAHDFRHVLLLSLGQSRPIDPPAERYCHHEQR